MKKDIKTIIIIILLIIIIIIGGIGFFWWKYQQTKGNKQFAKEYESLNGTMTNSGKEYMSIEINDDVRVDYLSVKESLDVLENGTGVIYFGFPECPWCRNLVPVLLDALEEADYKKVYYCNALSERDKKSLDEEGNIITEQEGSKDYYALVERLKDYLGPYQGLNDDTIKRLYFPTVVFVKDGQIQMFHEGTIPSQDDPYVKLTDEQEDELENILITGVKKVQGILCTDDTKC